jgi:hypothetical protein
MSSLLDRYIHAVERHLPKAQRHDIGEELRETIQSRLDEDTADRGRDLTEAEQAVILKSIGRPVVVASRYGTAQYLVGPSLYPYYVATLKTLATIGLPLLVIGMVVGALGGDNPLVGALRVVGRSINAAWITLGVVTFIFWQMERVSPKPNFDAEWEPTHLPQLPIEQPRAVPRAASISHAAFLAVYLLWWVGLPLPQLLRLDWFTERYAPVLAPVWQDVFLAIALLLGFQLLLQLVNIWRPHVSKWRLALHMASDVVALGVIYYLLQANDLVIMPSSGPWAGQHEAINDATKLGLLVVGVLIAIGLVFDEGKRMLGMQPWQWFGRSDLAGAVAVRAVRATGVRPSRPRRL